MPEQTTVCRKLACCDSEGSNLGDFSSFSLVGGDFPGGDIDGNEESTFIVECPPGIICEEGTYPLYITIPPDTIINPYGAPGPPGGPTTIRVPCAGGARVTILDANATQAEKAAAIAQMIADCGQDTAEYQPPPVQTASVATLYVSKEQGVSCDGLAFCSNPGGLFAWNNNTKVATLPSGTFTSYESQEAADAKASQYITDQLAKYKANGGKCGYWNTEQTVTCADSTTRTTDANTICSEVSQADANTQAQDQAEAECPQECIGIDWSGMVWSASGDASGGGGGSSGNASVTGTGVQKVGAVTGVPYVQTGPGNVTCNLTVSGSVGAAPNYVRVRVGGTKRFDTGDGDTFGTFAISVSPSAAGNVVIEVGADVGQTTSAAVNVGPI